MPLLRYLIKRITGLIAVLLVMSFIVFCLQSIIPADPARAMAGPMASSETVEAIRAQLRLDDPIAVQYGRFLSRLLHGDLGTSIRTRQPVSQDVLEYATPSLELILVSTFIGLALAGLLALMQQGFGSIGAVRVVIVGAGSSPIFLSALLLVYFFWFRLNWLPGTGRLSNSGFSGPTGFDLIDGILVGAPGVSLDALRHLILPAFAMALPIAVAVGRTLSSSLHDVMRQSYIRTARGKGLSETQVLLRHGLRNAASAPLAMTAMQVRLIFANLLIVEQVFGRPGLGLYTVQAFASADLPAVLGVAMVFGTFYILVSILIEIAQSLSDPRILL